MKRSIARIAMLFSAALVPMAQAQTTSSAQQQPPANVQSQQQGIYLPPGTDVQVRVNESISSDRAQAGDTFTGTLINSIEDDSGRIIFYRGANVTGRVISARPSGRLQDSGQLVLAINGLRSDTQYASLTVSPKQLNGASHSTSNTEKVGGGAILGAIIGGIAGGGRGAAIGAGAGAAAGTGAAAATGKREARVDTETILHFVTNAETSVVPANSPQARQAAQQSQLPSDIYSPGNDSSPRDPDVPVLHRRNNAATNGSNGDNAAQESAGNMPSSASYPPSGPPDNSGAQNYPPNNSGAPAGGMPNTNSYPDSSAAPSTNTPDPNWGFSARDRRVISTCLAENPSSAPAAATANSIPYRKGDTLPYAAQHDMRSLPLACERQLPAVNNDLERVIYHRQVLLINGNNLVLDSFDIASNK